MLKIPELPLILHIDTQPLVSFRLEKYAILMQINTQFASTARCEWKSNVRTRVVGSCVEVLAVVVDFVL